MTRAGLPSSVELREQIGQLLIVGFRGCTLREDDPIVCDLRERRLGGVILFDQEMADPARGERNIRSPEQLRALVTSLQQHAATPLLVAIDQEGGRVNRLKPAYGFPETVSQEELGRTDIPATTFEHAARIARTLAGLGINLNFAPVVDLDAHPDNPIIKGKQRSFGADPERVSRHALAFARAHRSHGVLCCAKHFPGHGSARGDTHLGLVDVTDTWSERELIPFRHLIESGACDVIMSAHVFNTRLDPEHPATLSRKVLTGLLRERLGYDGAITSDDLEMKAISSHYGLERALELGLNAGLDLLCFGNNMSYDPDITARVIAIIAHLVESGRVPETRLREALGRVQRLKRQLNLIA
jgi:beta-N-acetylhexosaminidase